MDTSPTVSAQSPWHEGELALQRSVGAVARMVEPGRKQMARAFMPDQHREFYAQLPFVVLGAVDPAGEVWATLRSGQPGFMRSAAPERLMLTLPRTPEDPADAGMEDGQGIGMLGIELHTRRRNRMNGRIRRSGDDGFAIDVTQAYGNCPQYIQLRQYRFVDAQPGVVKESAQLDAAARAMIAAADSFYVASYVERDGERQVDASHRGGKAGFVLVGEDGTLTIPDFAGNKFFNTLGNFLLNPRAGMVFVDFDTGDILQMTGRAEVVLDAPELHAFVGAERLWRFKPQRVIRRPAALSLRWSDLDNAVSPNSLITGSWSDAVARMKAAALAREWRAFRVERVVDESSDIRSFHLAPADGIGIPLVAAGQHLPVRLTLPGSSTPQMRTYTLSSAPSDGFFRISVKRDGVFSRYLHDAIQVGDIIEARAPAGNFTIDAAVRRPAVLLAAGIGVTPMLSMARHVVHEGLRQRYQRPVWLFHAARSTPQRAFDREIADLIARGKEGFRHIRVLSNIDGAEAGTDYDAGGRISVELLKRTLPFDDYDFYLCGPASFMQQLYDALRDMRVADDRIHAEGFGPSSLVRVKEPGTPEVTVVAVAGTTVEINFVRSAKQARWLPTSGTLLDLAEQSGLAPESSCRGGNCGSCRTRVLGGAVTYARPPSFSVAADEALICCAMPAEGSFALQLDL